MPYLTQIHGHTRKPKLGAAFVLFIPPCCIWWLLCDSRHTDDLVRDKQLESTAAASIPNYGRIWYAKNLIWENSQHLGGELCDFGLDAEQFQYNWTELCSLDSDGDNWTNGEELGDPCCIWHPGMKLPWWPATDPSRNEDFPPWSMRFDTSSCVGLTTSVTRMPMLPSLTMLLRCFSTQSTLVTLNKKPHCI